MTVLLVTYDLRAPGRDYATVHAYLGVFTHCKKMESVWLLDTPLGAEQIRDGLMKYIDATDVLFVTPLARAWVSYNYGCAAWLNDPARTW
jgi:hypothetical protein